MGLLGFWPPTYIGDIIQIPWTYYHNLGEYLAHGGGQPIESKGELGASIKDPGKGRGNVRVLGKFFNTAVHAVLLFGSEMWLMNPHMVHTLGCFQHREALRIKVKQLGRL